jgi:beta-mannanase
LIPWVRRAIAVIVALVLAGMITSAGTLGDGSRSGKALFLFGAAVADLPAGRDQLPALEAKLNRPVDIASTYVDWNYVFPGPNEKWMAADGKRKVLLSWEPWGIRFSEVTARRHDAYLESIAKAMRGFPFDLHVRPWAEMNANWSTWQPTPKGDKADGGTPAQFVAAWRYVVSFFRDRGIRNLKFVFNPDASTWPSNTPVSSIWPGAEYVDVLGIDGFNWGESGDNSAGETTWRSFEEIFTPMYSILTRLHPKAAVWIAEFGCAPDTGGTPPAASATRATWLAEMMTTRAFPRLEAVVYFDVKARVDWRLDSPTAWKAILSRRR